jgi:hypothetical protein
MQTSKLSRRVGDTGEETRCAPAQSTRTSRGDDVPRQCSRERGADADYPPWLEMRQLLIRRARGPWAPGQSHRLAETLNSRGDAF